MVLMVPVLSHSNLPHVYYFRVGEKCYNGLFEEWSIQEQAESDCSKHTGWLGQQERAVIKSQDYTVFHDRTKSECDTNS